MNESELLGRVNDLMQQERWVDAIAAAGVMNEHACRDLVWAVGWAHFKLGQYSDALPYLKGAAETGPVDHASLGTLGITYLKLKRYVEAELWLLRAIATRDSSMSRLFLAIVYMDQGLDEEAEAVHKEGLRLRPNDSKRHEQYADFLSDAGREDEAKMMYERAVILREREGKAS